MIAMKRIITAVLAVAAALFMLTSCGKDDVKQELTDKVTTTKKIIEDDMFDKDAGVPKSTDMDSALGNGIKNAVDKAERLDDEIGHDLEEAGDKINRQ